MAKLCLVSIISLLHCNGEDFFKYACVMFAQVYYYHCQSLFIQKEIDLPHSNEYAQIESFELRIVHFSGSVNHAGLKTF